jgi:hypothetical protein
MVGFDVKEMLVTKRVTKAQNGISLNELNWLSVWYNALNKVLNLEAS